MPRNQQDNTKIRSSQIDLKPGEVKIVELAERTLFYAYNFEKDDVIQFGSTIGTVFEKPAPMLQYPEPSFCILPTELEAIKYSGAKYIRILSQGKTFCISVRDFEAHAVDYDHKNYGHQHRVPIKFFQVIFRVGKRNNSIDHPPEEITDPMQPITIKHEPLWKKLDLFSR